MTDELMRACEALAASTLDMEAVAATGEIEWETVEAAADKLAALLEHRTA